MATFTLLSICQQFSSDWVICYRFLIYLADPSVNRVCWFCCAVRESNGFPILQTAQFSCVTIASCSWPSIGISEISSFKAVTPYGTDIACSWIYHFHFIMLDSWTYPTLWVWGKLCTHCMIGTWCLNITVWSIVNCFISIKAQ